MIDFAQVQRAYDSMTPEDCDATLHTCTHPKCDRDTHNVDRTATPTLTAMGCASAPDWPGQHGIARQRAPWGAALFYNFIHVL